MQKRPLKRRQTLSQNPVMRMVSSMRCTVLCIFPANETFKWNIIGYDAAHGGLPYFCAYMIAMFLGECINFPLQRNVVFRSKGNVAKQIGWYFLAFCVITCIVNSINCVWVAVAGMFVPDFIYNIGTTVLNGGVSMIIFFFVNKIIFPEGKVE